MSYLASLQQKTNDELINELYNIQVSRLADYSNEEHKTIDKHGHGKRIPYIGWFWRNTDFVGKRVSIGDCGSFIGVMENNKWGYAEREMTAEEVDKFIEYIERGFAGQDKAEEVFNELWGWFQTLRDTGDWCADYQWEYAL